MKFGKIFVFPDPDSRVKFEPLKLVYVKPLEFTGWLAHYPRAVKYGIG